MSNSEASVYFITPHMVHDECKVRDTKEKFLRSNLILLVKSQCFRKLCGKSVLIISSKDTYLSIRILYSYMYGMVF